MRQTGDLVEQPGGHHRLDTPLDALGQGGARPADAELRDVGRWEGGDAWTERAERLPAADRHLEGAHDAPAVGRIDLVGGVRVEALQPVVEGGGIGLLVERGAHVRPGTGQLEAVDGRSQVQPGTGDEERPCWAGARRLRRGRRRRRGGTR